MGAANIRLEREKEIGAKRMEKSVKAGNKHTGHLTNANEGLNKKAAEAQEKTEVAQKKESKLEVADKEVTFKKNRLAGMTPEQRNAAMANMSPAERAALLASLDPKERAEMEQKMMAAKAAVEGYQKAEEQDMKMMEQDGKQEAKEGEAKAEEQRRLDEM